MGTNKVLLVKGLRTMAMSLLFVIIGPSVLYSAFNNQDHPLYIPVLILGLLAMAAALFFGFKGLRKIMRAVFDS
ncbi:DUF6095 family protein [Croceiramulus getboli]|nr:DUF6095 family protein [Flavobacteriaceae bacterium YJPT1-3]